MIINLDMDLASLESLASEIRDELVHELVRMHRHGYHVLIIERSLVDCLLRVCDLSDMYRSTLLGIRSEYTQTGGLVNEAPYLLKISARDRFQKTSTRVIVEMTPARFLSARIAASPTRLVVEDAVSDRALYEFLIKNTSDLFRITNPKWVIDNGGGNRIADVVAARAEEGYVVMAIVDTDHWAPRAVVCEKQRSVSQKIENVNWPLAFCLATPAREGENLLPLSALAEHRHLKVCSARDLLQKITDAERDLKEQPERSFILFFDLKNGISPEVWNSIKTQEEKEFVAQRLALIGINIEIAKISGFGDRIVDRLLEEGAAAADFRRGVRTSAWLSLFGTFLRCIVWALAGRQHQAA